MTMQRWNIDTSHSGIEFSVRHLMISKVRGAFETWRGTIDFDSNEPEASKVSVQIEAGSIDTREPSRDAHLRSADFFDVEKYPSLTFESRKVERAGDNRYRVIGDLTLHGVTRSVVLDAEYLGTGMDAWGKERIGFFAKTAWWSVIKWTLPSMSKPSMLRQSGRQRRFACASTLDDSKIQLC